jgi:hypothetical protein
MIGLFKRSARIHNRGYTTEVLRRTRYGWEELHYVLASICRRFERVVLRLRSEIASGYLKTGIRIVG